MNIGREQVSETPVTGQESEKYKAPKLIIGALMVTLFLSALDNTIVGTALATIAGKLGGFDRFTWVTTAYAACSTIATLVLGKLSDLYGRRNLLLFTIALFLGASLLCGVAQTMNQLIAARALQGIGGGGIWGLTFACIGDIIPPRERGRYFGLFTSMFALASVVGPLIGGVIVDRASWRWIFLVNMPLGIIAFTALVLVLKLPRPVGRPSIDFPGIGLVILAIGGLMITLERGGKLGFTSKPILLGFALSISALIALMIWETKSTEPIVPLRLFANPHLRLVYLIGFMVGPNLMVIGTFFSLYFQDVRFLTPTRAGLQGVPMMIGMVLGSTLSGRFITKTGRYKLLPLIGFVLSLIGMVGAWRTSTSTPLLVIGLVMGLVGLGTGLSMPTLSIVSQNSAEPRDLGISSATSNFMRSLGGAVALAIVSVWFNTNLKNNLRAKLPNANTGSLSKLIRAPKEIMKLDAPVRDAVTGSIAQGVAAVFGAGVVLATIGFLLSFAIREQPLRATHGQLVPPAE